MIEDKIARKKALHKAKTIQGIYPLICKVAREEYYRFPKHAVSLQDVIHMGVEKASKVYEYWDFDRCKFTTCKGHIWGHIVSQARKYKNEDKYKTTFSDVEAGETVGSNKLKSAKERLIQNSKKELEEEEFKALLDTILYEFPPRRADAVRASLEIGGMTKVYWRRIYQVTHTIYYAELKEARKNIKDKYPELKSYCENY